MEKPKKEIQSPRGVKFEIFEYITGRDIKKVSEVVSQQGRGKSIDAMIEIGLISIEGSNENLSERLLDLHGEDYVFIIQKISNLFNIGQEKKTEESMR
jgi:hypothetical protein